MKSGNRLALLIGCTMLAIAACKKDDTPTPTPTPPYVRTQRDYLQDGKWQITKIPVKVSVYGFPLDSVDAYDTVKACAKDDYAIFKSWGKIYTYENTQKCNSANPDVDSSGTWTLSDDFKKMTADVKSYPLNNKNFDVLELTDTSLVLYQSFDTTYMSYPANVKVRVLFKNIK